MPTCRLGLGRGPLSDAAKTGKLRTGTQWAALINDPLYRGPTAYTGRGSPSLVSISGRIVLGSCGALAGRSTGARVANAVRRGTSSGKDRPPVILLSQHPRGAPGRPTGAADSKHSWSLSDGGRRWTMHRRPFRESVVIGRRYFAARMPLYAGRRLPARVWHGGGLKRPALPEFFSTKNARSQRYGDDIYCRHF